MNKYIVQFTGKRISGTYSFHSPANHTTNSAVKMFRKTSVDFRDAKVICVFRIKSKPVRKYSLTADEMKEIRGFVDSGSGCPYLSKSLEAHYFNTYKLQEEQRAKDRLIEKSIINLC